MSSTKYYTLSEIARKLGIARQSLTKYKALEAVPGGRLWPHCIGDGNYMKFNDDALEVFAQMRVEGMNRRGKYERDGED